MTDTTTIEGFYSEPTEPTTSTAAAVPRAKRATKTAKAAAKAKKKPTVVAKTAKAAKPAKKAAAAAGKKAAPTKRSYADRVRWANEKQYEQTVLWAHKSLKARMRKLAAQRGVKMTEIIRTAVEQHLKRAGV